MATNDLESRVERLSYDDLVEAANFYLPEVVGTADLQAVERKLAAEVQRRGGQYLELKERLRDVREDEESIQYLLRAVLLQAARGDEEDKRRLAEALDGVGKSQLIIELLFAISAAVTVVWLIKPPREERETTKRETRPDGTKIETTERSVKEVPPPINKLFGWTKGLKGDSSGQNG